jgi:RHH-type proline utilization regulon transcriptional repressor/proline dehydrogenase/delta 1-pyrroline-5-carboxylate dehydrogenase
MYIKYIDMHFNEHTALGILTRLNEHLGHAPVPPSELCALWQSYDLSAHQSEVLVGLLVQLIRIQDTHSQNAVIEDTVKDHAWMQGEKNNNNNILYWVNTALSYLTGSNAYRILAKSLPHLKQKITQHFILPNLTQASASLKQKISSGYQTLWNHPGPKAHTARDAEVYIEELYQTLHQIHQHHASPPGHHGVCIKLSRLYPIDNLMHLEPIGQTLLEVLIGLIEKARESHIPLTFDTESLSLLPLSLYLFEKLLRDPRTQGYHGLGYTVCAFTTLAPDIIQHLSSAAHDCHRPISIRFTDEIILSIEDDSGHPYQDTIIHEKIFQDIAFIYGIITLKECQEYIQPTFATENEYYISAIQQLLGHSHRYTLEFYYGQNENLAHMLFLSSGGFIHCCLNIPVTNGRSAPDYLQKRLSTYALRNSATKGSSPEYPANLLHMAKEKILEDTGSDPTTKSFFYRALNRFTLDDHESFVHALEAQKKIWRDQPPHGEAISCRNSGDLLGYARWAETPINWPLETLKGASTWQASGPDERGAVITRALNTLTQSSLIFSAKWVLEAGIPWLQARQEISDILTMLSELHPILSLLDNPHRADGVTYHYNPQGTWVIEAEGHHNISILLREILHSLLAGNTTLVIVYTPIPLILQDMAAWLYDAGIPLDALAVAIYPLSSPRIPHQITHHAGTTQVGQPPSSLEQATVSVTYRHNIGLSDASVSEDALIDAMIQSAFYHNGDHPSKTILWYCEETRWDNITSRLEERLLMLRVESSHSPWCDIGPLAPISLERFHAHLTWCEKNARLIAKGSIQHKNTPDGALPVVYELPIGTPLPEHVVGPILHLVRYRKQDITQVFDALTAYPHPYCILLYSTIPSFIALCEKKSPTDVLALGTVARNHARTLVHIPDQPLNFPYWRVSQRIQKVPASRSTWAAKTSYQ